MKNIIGELLKQHKTLHFSLIDPDKQIPKEAGQRAKICTDYGTNAILVGGSTVKERQRMYDTIQAIKKNVKVPIILFPNSADTIPENIDYILFMRLLNAKEHKYHFGEQARGAPLVKKWNIKTIATGYIIISTSNSPTTIEKIVKLHKIKTNNIEKAVEYAIYAENLGMYCVYLDAGSDAEKPVSNEMIRGIRDEINLPIIVGGGINNADIAREKVDAGAKIVVNGTATENNINVIEKIIKRINDDK